MHFRRAMPMMVAISCVLCSLSGAEVELVPGVPIEREIARGETHAYQIKLAAGQYLQAVADQRGIDLQLAAFAPDEKELISIDTLSGQSGREPVSVLAETSGSYRLEVSPVNRKAPKGQYLIRIEELRAAAPEDNTRIAAQKAFAEGRKLHEEQSYSQSLQRYEQALGLWQAVSDVWHAAVTLNEIGGVNNDMGRPNERTIPRLNQALALWRNLNDSRGEAEMLSNLGEVQLNLGDFRQALEYFDRASRL